MKGIYDSRLLIAALFCCILIPYFMCAQEREVKDPHVLSSGFAMKIERMGGYLGSYSAFWIYPDGQVINLLGEAAKIPSEVVEQWTKTIIPDITPPIPGASTGIGEMSRLMGQLCFDCSGYQISIYDKERGGVRGFYGSTAEVTKTFPDLINRLQHLAWSPLMGTPMDAQEQNGLIKRQAIKVGSNVQESKLIKREEPVYPELAKRAHVEGRVLLVVTIDEEGSVSEIRVIAGHPLLVEAALNAVRQWKYSPTLLNGEPVPVIATVTVRFTFAALDETAVPVGN